MPAGGNEKHSENSYNSDLESMHAMQAVRG